MISVWCVRAQCTRTSSACALLLSVQFIMLYINHHHHQAFILLIIILNSQRIYAKLDFERISDFFLLHFFTLRPFAAVRRRSIGKLKTMDSNKADN